MLDLLAPLGRPPLDTFSPTQMVRTAEPVPAGIWEIEGGGAVALPSAALPFAGLRYGLAPGLDFSLGMPGPNGLLRPLASFAIAPIPALWSVNLNLDSVPSFNLPVPPLSIGTVAQIALPWITPRLAFRARIAEGNALATLFYRASLGAETRLLRSLDIGAEFDLGIGEPTFANLGLRFRPAGNLGISLFSSVPVDPGSAKISTPVTIGVLTALRF